MTGGALGSTSPSATILPHPVLLRLFEDKVETDGAPVLLNPQAYATVALVIHELVTNSAKYGALKGPGQVFIRWSQTTTGDLEIVWSERGGPADLHAVPSGL